MPTLYILIGLPASGKTTYAKTTLKNAYRVCHDDLVDMLMGEYDIKKTATMHAVEWSIVHTILSRGEDVVVDRTNLDPVTRARFINAAQSVDIPVGIIGVVVDVPIETCKERNRMRVKPIPDEAYTRLAAHWMPARMEEGFDRLELISPGKDD